MKSYLLVVALVIAISTSCMAKLLTDEFIESINSKQTTWTAARKFPAKVPIEELKRRLTGTFKPNATNNVAKKVHKINYASIFEYSDSRENWPQSESIREIRSQGYCGAYSSIAMATSSMAKLLAYTFIKHQVNTLGCCS